MDQIPEVPEQVIVTPTPDWQSKTLTVALIWAASHFFPAVKDFTAANPEIDAIVASTIMVVFRYLTKSPLKSTVPK